MIWTLFCVAIAVIVMKIANVTSAAGIDDSLTGVAIYGILFLCIFSILLGPLIAILFGITSKQSECVANKAREAYENLAPETQEKVRRGGVVLLGLAAGYLADHMERKGNKNAARKLGGISDQM